MTTRTRRASGAALSVAASATVACCCAVIGTSTVARAQSLGADVERFQRQLEQIRRDTIAETNATVPLTQRVYVDYGAYATAAYLSVDDNVDNNHVLRQYELLPYVRVNLDGAHEFFLRGIGGWQDFNDGDSFDGRGDERIDPDIDRGYYRLDLARAAAARGGRPPDYDVVLLAGRDLVYWANGLVLSEAIDGVQVTISDLLPVVDVFAIAGVTPVRTIDFDATRPDFDFNTRRGFYGLMLSTDIGRHRPFVYGLVQQDYNDDEALVTGPITTEFEYDSHYLGIGATGSLSDRLLYGVEAVYEGGHGLSNSFVVGGPFISQIPQEQESIQAWAGDVRLDYLLADARRSRFSAEFIIASGDDDRLTSSNTFGGNQPGTNDNAFNAFGLLNTGLAFAPAVSNLTCLRVGASTFPFTDGGVLGRMQLGADVFGYAKTDEDAPIDEPTSDERYLGWEPDVYINWQLTSDLTLALRYGVFFPSSDAFGDDEPRQFVYGGVTYAF
jgi:hypothetical protein